MLTELRHWHAAGLRDFTLLRVDVTANSAEHKALMKRYGLFGPPALLFFPPAGGELAQARVIGFVGADALAAMRPPSTLSEAM